jgi:hypothetical protein
MGIIKFAALEDSTFMHHKAFLAHGFLKLATDRFIIFESSWNLAAATPSSSWFKLQFTLFVSLVVARKIEIHGDDTVG